MLQATRRAKPTVTIPRRNKPPVYKVAHDRGITHTKGMTKLRETLRNSDNPRWHEEEEKLEEEEKIEDPAFLALRARREDEEASLDQLGRNHDFLHNLVSAEAGSFFMHQFGDYLYKRARRPAQSEVELKAEFKGDYKFKTVFERNRQLRNEEYVQQRKKDFVVSQARVQKLVEKLRNEYEAAVAESLRRCAVWKERMETAAEERIQNLAKEAADRICGSAEVLATIADALSFTPTCYSQIVRFFHRKHLTFNKDCEMVPEFSVQNYMKPLRSDTQRLFVTLCEACEPGSMVLPLPVRKARAVSILTKPHVFNEDECANMAEGLGWKAVFAEKLADPVRQIFDILSNSEEDVMVFGFPRTPKELENLSDLFNPLCEETENEKFLPRPVRSVLKPFDMIIELDVDDEVVLRDVLAELEDSSDGSRYDVRQLFLDKEEELVRLRSIPDPNFDVLQYPTRAITMKMNFQLIAESTKDVFKTVELENRLMNEDTVGKVAPLLAEIPTVVPPSYSPTSVYPAILEVSRNMTDELKSFFVEQWKSIEASYADSVKSAFELLNRAHLLMLGHLEKSRSEMEQLLCRTGSSQHLIVEFQQWHCSQVERGMRKMQKVKDECNLRLAALRESLILIEDDRKAEEENKQKDLLNAPFRTTLFEIVNNACTMLAQSEIDRWTSTRSLMLDYNQVLTDADLVPPLPRKRLNMVADAARAPPKKGAKRTSRTTPTSKSRADNKLQPFESPLFEQLEMIKKFVTDATVIYAQTTTPVSTRAKGRPVKDKNPFAPHKIVPLEELAAAFADDDVFLMAKIDQISEMARDEFQSVQQAFDAFVEDSTKCIQEHYLRRRAIADTVVAYMQKKVDEEEQLNELILIEEDKCTVDFTRLLVATEESPKIPPPFPEQSIEESITGEPETVIHNVLEFQQEASAQ